MQKWLQLSFLVLGFLSIFAYLFIADLLVAYVVMALIWLGGLSNMLLALRNRDTHLGLLYLLCTIALNVGYWKQLFF